MERIYSLDVLRLIAVLGVVSAHCCAFKPGIIGVEFCFVLSGFLAIKNIEDRSFVQFFKRQLQIQYPMVLITTLGALLLEYIHIKTAFFQLLFLQDFPGVIDSYGIEVYSYWFLSALFFVYAIACPIVKISKL